MREMERKCEKGSIHGVADDHGEKGDKWSL